MGKFALNLNAELTGVKNLAPKDEESFYYAFKVQCSGCREIHDNAIEISRSETHSIPGSKGEANLIWTCKNCRKTCSFVIEGPFSPYNDSQETKKVLVLECRGCELVEFIPQGEWTANGAESNTLFDEIVLEDDWYDYDENASSEVSITNLEWSISKA